MYAIWRCVCSEKTKNFNISSMEVGRLSALEHVQEIRDYLHVNIYSPDLKSLWFLKSLRIIRGYRSE